MPAKKNKKQPPLEIERKFILKKLPVFDKKVDSMRIIQFYVDKNGQTIRYRKSANSEKTNYYRTIKTAVSKGVWIEDEKKINPKQFVVDVAEVGKRRVLEKVRFVYKYKGLKFEIDCYEGVSLITLEVELDDIKQVIDFPECIKKEILLEVTGKKAFSNYNLAEEHRGKITGGTFLTPIP